MSLFIKNVIGYKANKLFIPITVWRNISKNAKLKIKSIFLQKIHNPFNCFFNQQTKVKCKIKVEVEEKGKKGISACYKCARCEVINKAMSKTKKYICFERFNKSANMRLYNILEDEGFKISFKNRSVFPKKSLWKVYDSKLDSTRANEQKKLANIWLSKKNGVLVCPPRFGKVLLTAFIASKMQTRVLILVHKIELARQFYKDYLDFTSLKKSEIAINPDMNNLKYLSVAICTYQQFISKNGPKRVQLAKKEFGLLIVDEIHKAASDTFHKVINSFYAKYRLGVTATPKRRDAREFLNEFTFGPILVKGGTEQLSCDYIITNTNLETSSPRNQRGWDGLWNKLASSKERNSLVADYVIKDLENGHKIILPVKRHKQMELLCSLIKEKVSENKLNIKICLYHGKLNKKYREVLQKDIRSGEYDVVIGSDQILSLGFNAPPMSCIYINLHTYRTFEEDLYQEFSRIRTAYEHKNKPLIRVFQDISQASDRSIEKIENILNKYNFTRIEEKKEKFKQSKRGLNILF